jgi:hypothetical protein
MVRFGGGCQTNDLFIPISFKVVKRAAPTMSAWQNDGTSGNWYYVRSGAAQAQTVVWNYTGTSQSVATINAGTTYAITIAYGQWAASAEL